MAHTVADHLLDRLEEWGVHTIFGYSGDGINGILGALDRPETVSSSSSLVTRRWPPSWPGLCQVHRRRCTRRLSGHVGPGAIHLLNGLYDAKMDHQPVLAIVGQKAYIPRCLLSARGRPSSLKDVAGDFVHVAMVPEQIRHLGPGDAYCPVGANRCLPDHPGRRAGPRRHGKPPREHGAAFSGTSFTRHRPIPSPEDLAKAADILNAGERVAMLVGAGALGATDEVIQVADRLGAGVAKALLGKAAVPDECRSSPDQLARWGLRRRGV